jgi:transposase
LHVLSTERIHADDKTVPVLAKMKTVTGWIWTYVRDDRPFGGKDSPGAVFRYSRTRAGENPQQHLASYVGIKQADAFAGFNPLCDAKRRPAPIIEAACWSHGRRCFFKLAQANKAPTAIEAVHCIDELFEIERTIKGLTPQQRVAVRQAKSKPLVADLEVQLRQKLALLSSTSDTAKAINYSLSRWEAFTRFLDDGRVCLSNNATERSIRCVAVGRKNWTFAGSDAGATEQPRSMPLSRHASSTTSIHKLGSPTCWHARRITQQTKSQTFCRGIGKPPASQQLPDRPRAPNGPVSPRLTAGAKPRLNERPRRRSRRCARPDIHAR